MPPKTLTLTDQLRKAIEGSDDSQYRIAKKAGISLGMLTRFLAGERDLRLATVVKLIAGLEMETSLKPKAKQAK
jgi:predicted transcriptional regulator